MTVGIVFFVSILLSGVDHPYHVSVCDVEYNANEHSLQVSQRLFLNDLEDALDKRFSVRLDVMDPSTAQLRDSLIHSYIFERFNLEIDGVKKRRVYIGNEIEEDGMWIYFEYPDVKTLHEVSVTSRILFELFDDQANIVHVKYHDVIHSKKLDRKTPTDQFIFEGP